MAKKENEDTKQEGEDAEVQPKSKKGIFLGGGMVSLIALAYIVSMVAVPRGSQKTPAFEGPFVAFPLADGDVQVNMAKGGGKSFLVLNFKVEFDGYDQLYAEKRIADPLFQAHMIDALIRLGRKKAKEDLASEIGVEVFTAEIRDALDPLLFPLHLGNELSSTDPHTESNLQLGRSSQQSSMRSGFKAHVLKVDALKKTIALDYGSEVTFTGSERDLIVENERGQRIYVDVSELNPEFVGELQVGTFGKMRNILFTRFLVQ